MGVKGESGNHRAKPVATNEQLRLAQLTLEGKSNDDDPLKIQRLIKKVIETTRCSQSQAELALYDNDNDLAAAVDYILEHSSELESWTELKKSEKKKDDDDRRPYRGQSSTRGRGAYIERGTRGRGAVTPSRGTPRGVSSAPSRGRGAASVASRPVKQDAVHKPALETEAGDENVDWKNGPMEFKQSAEASSSTAIPTSSDTNATTAAPSSAVPAPISFAAVAAAAARKEQMRQQQLAAPPAPVVPVVEASPVEYHNDEPETSVVPEPVAEDSYLSEPSVANPVEEVEPVVEEEPEVAAPPVPSPTIQANASWTNQLKSELGIGLPIDSDVSAQFSSVTVQSRAPAPAGVEFATDSVPTGLADYQFGFVDVPAPAPVEIPPPAPSHPVNVPTAESMFSSSRHSSMVPPQKPVESERLPANEYSTKASPPTGHYGHSGRSLGFGDASTVSYTPTVNDRMQQSAKPSSHMSHNQVPQQQQQQQPQQQQQQQPQQQQNQSQQQMFPPQLPYNAFPYMNMNMYSPVTGVRADDPYSAALMQYPFSGMGVDLSTMLPGTTPMSQSATNQQMQSSQHRSDSHNMDGMKYQSQNAREQNQQPSNVAPPPGFANPASFMGQPALSSLFMQQQYPPHPYSFMMPNVGNAGRQMYTQDDERKTYEKMGGSKQAQPTPPPHYHNNGAGYLNIGGMKKPYNWNN